MAMAHDEHFLTRLQRLESEHTELALGLYFDHELVHRMLASVKLPDGCERVALCLGQPGAGPHLIVARDGHFVTALSEGMVLHPDEPVISRARLDKISESLGALRTLLTEAETGAHHQTQRLTRRVYSAGPALSQEEFEALARWLPLLDVRFVLAHIELTSECHLIMERLSRARRITRGHEKLLRQYWRRAWAAAHLTMLLGSDGGERLRAIFDRLDHEDPTMPTQMAWSMVRLGVTSFAQRGAWSVSKMPNHVLAPAKNRYLHNPNITPLMSMTDAVSLATIGLRHRRQRAAIGKILRKRSGALLDLDTHPSVIQTREVAAARYTAYESDLEAAFAASVAAGRAAVGRQWPALTADELDGMGLTLAAGLAVQRQSSLRSSGPRSSHARW